MYCLITGANGFIGSHLARGARKLGYEVYGTYRGEKPTNPDIHWVKWDLTDMATLEESLPDFKVVFHLAGMSHPNAGNPNDILFTNVRSTLNLLEHTHFNRFVFASSIVVYGDSDKTAEDNACMPTTMYGVSKAVCDDVLWVRHITHNMNFLSLRLSAVVGPNMTHGFLPVLLKKLRSPDKEITLLGASPGTIKPYTHIYDVVSAFLYAADIRYVGTVNYSAPGSIPIRDIANTVMGVLNIHKKINWAGEQSLWPGDNKLLVPETQLSYNLGFRYKYTSIKAIENSL